MHTILVVSPYSDSVAKIRAVATGLPVTVVHAVDEASARTLLASTTFAMIFVDAAFDKRAIGYLMLAWKYSPEGHGGLFKLTGTIAEPWEAKFFGAQIYDGLDCLEQLRETLVGLTAATPSDEQFSKRVLFVEDLDAPRFIVCRYIEALGYHDPLGVTSAEEGLRVLREDAESFFCILTDLKMPKMNGVEFIKIIRSDPQLQHLPIIALTAIPSPEHLIECLRAGATGFLVKPPLKRDLRIELEKARRLYRSKQSPRLCKPEEAHHLETTLRKFGFFSA